MDIDEVTAAREMYVSLDMLRVMARNGMHIGAHGKSHVWLDKEDAERQAREIDANLDMLRQVYGGKAFFWSIAYPYGAWNGDTRRLCNGRDASFGLTTEAKDAVITEDMRLVLPRVDVNDVLRLP
jgi:peptidoglycan/xylan/chitin deacetylase (PgdA/CDA1 family)